MWTKKEIPGTVLIKSIILFSLLSFSLQLDAQKMQMIKGYCGIYYKNMEDLYKQKQSELDFYGFRPRQTVASIGVQCGHWEAAYASTTDSIRFYLEDIDSSLFNKRQIDFAWHYYDSLQKKRMTSNFSLRIGTERSTGLPANSFDKILIINSFHEFTYMDEMLADIKTKLKPDGILYIDESVPKRPGQPHGVCKKTMLTPEEMVSILSKNGYEYINSLELQFRKARPLRKIYAFRKIN